LRAGPGASMEYLSKNQTCRGGLRSVSLRQATPRTNTQVTRWVAISRVESASAPHLLLLHRTGRSRSAHFRTTISRPPIKVLQERNSCIESFGLSFVALPLRTSPRLDTGSIAYPHKKSSATKRLISLSPFIAFTAWAIGKIASGGQGAFLL